MCRGLDDAALHDGGMLDIYPPRQIQRSWRWEFGVILGPILGPALAAG